MNQNNPIDPKPTSPDDLTKTTPTGNVELNEEELGKASGGVDISEFQITKVIDKSSPTL